MSITEETLLAFCDWAQEGLYDRPTVQRVVGRMVDELRSLQKENKQLEEALREIAEFDVKAELPRVRSPHPGSLPLSDEPTPEEKVVQYGFGLGYVQARAKRARERREGVSGEEKVYVSQQLLEGYIEHITASQLRVAELEDALGEACDMVERCGKAYVDYDPPKLAALRNLGEKE